MADNAGVGFVCKRDAVVETAAGHVLKNDQRFDAAPRVL